MVGRDSVEPLSLSQLHSRASGAGRLPPTRVGIVGEPVIAVVKITTRITESDGVARTMRNVSIVRKTVAENDDLGKCRRLRVNENWSRQKNGDVSKVFSFP